MAFVTLVMLQSSEASKDAYKPCGINSPLVLKNFLRPCAPVQTMSVDGANLTMFVLFFFKSLSVPKMVKWASNIRKVWFQLA
jgi:hypothetical protein